MNFFRKVFGFLIIVLKKIFENWQAKLGSLFLASLFYVNLQTSKLTMKTVEIPIEYPKLNGGLVYGKQNDKTIRVKVEGIKDIVNYHIQFMKFVVDPGELNVGENLIEIKKIWGAASNRIKVTPIDGKLNVVVEQVASKSLPVEVIFEDDLPNGFFRTSYTIRPNVVNLNGPKSILDKINKYTLGTVSLKDARESFSRVLRPVDLPRGVSLQGGVREFQLRVNVLKAGSDAGDQIVRGIVVKCEGLDPNLDADLSIDEVSIKYSSNTPVSTLLFYDGIKASVPCNYTYDVVNKKILPNSLPVLAKIRINKSPNLKNVEIVSVAPDKITITYRPKNRDSNIPSKKIAKESEYLEEPTFPEPPEEEPSLK
jgi:hypothetical protein